MIGGECVEGVGKRAVLAGFQVPSRVVVFDTVTYKVISRGVKRHFYC